MDRAIRALKSLGAGFKLDKFSGEGNEDPIRFLNKFDRVAEYNEWGDEKKTNLIPLLLHDKAFEFYECLGEEKQADYKLVRAALTERFQPNKLNLLLWKELISRNINTGESTVEFHDVLKKLASKIRGISDKVLMMIFCNGLSMAATAYVALQQPATLAEAMKSACLFERVEELKKSESIQKRTPTLIHELREEICELAAEIKALTSSKKREQGSTQLSHGMDGGHYNYIQRNARSNVVTVKLKAPLGETINSIEGAQKEAKIAPHTNMEKGEKGTLNKMPDTNNRKYRDIVASQTGEKVASAEKIRAGSLVSENIGSRKVLRGEKNNLGKDKKDEIKIFVAQVRPKIQKGKEVNSVLGDADRKKDLSNVGTVGKTGPYIGGATVIARQEEVTRRQCGDQQKLKAEEGVNIRLTHRITISANSQTTAYACPDREIPQGFLGAVPFKSVW